MKKLLLIILNFTTLTTFAQNKDEKAILEVLDLEQKYWNAGDIEKYVSLYAPHDSTRMIFTSGAVYGRDSILAFYKKYWPKERMGNLVLKCDKLDRLSDEYYYISGFFEVSYPDRKPVKGRFSGLMRKMKGKWWMYTDHSG